MNIKSHGTTQLVEMLHIFPFCRQHLLRTAQLLDAVLTKRHGWAAAKYMGREQHCTSYSECGTTLYRHKGFSTAPIEIANIKRMPVSPLR